MSYLVHHLLRDAAARRPEAIAVLHRDASLAYAELESLSNGLALALRAEGVRRGDRVAIYLDKSPESLVAIHGILKAGGVYVPLDPGAPPQRLAYIMGNCGVRALVTSDRRLATVAEAMAAGFRPEVLLLADDGGRGAPPGVRLVPRNAWSGLRAPSAPDAGSIETDLAYILYTSGSTGLPKGVMISHRNALGFIEWAAGHFRVTEEDRLSSHAPLHFDLSIFDLFVAMKAGASVALVPDGTSTFPVRLAEWMRDSRISIWYSVPSILTLLLLKGRLDKVDLRRIRAVIFAGEVFPVKYLREVMRLLPHATFVNLYGPTETNVITWYEVPPLPDDRDDPVPIGWTCGNTDILLVDDAGRVIDAPGVQGELCARGVTVAQGYWGDRAKTDGVFVRNPFEPHYDDRMYRTGDIVTRDAEGCHRLVGRRDRMVKSRGYRIELDEIETVLNGHAEIQEAAVIAVPDELIGNRLRAFVSGRDGARLDTGAVREYCLQKLPRYMVPETIDVLDQLPKTSTGKIDRPSLAHR